MSLRSFSFPPLLRSRTSLTFLEVGGRDTDSSKGSFSWSVKERMLLRGKERRAGVEERGEVMGSKILRRLRVLERLFLPCFRGRGAVRKD